MTKPCENNLADEKTSVHKADQFSDFPKTVRFHPHLNVYKRYCSANQKGDKSALEEESATCNDVFYHALFNKGCIKKGLTLNSAEHAAALAGAAVWRLNNPTLRAGGAGRGQGRKAKDGQTDFFRISVNVRQDQHAHFKALGGSFWLRSQIKQEFEVVSSDTDLTKVGRKKVEVENKNIDFVRMSVNVLMGQLDEFKSLGGSTWLRARIDCLGEKSMTVHV